MTEIDGVPVGKLVGLLTADPSLQAILSRLLGEFSPELFRAVNEIISGGGFLSKPEWVKALRKARPEVSLQDAVTAYDVRDSLKQIPVILQQHPHRETKKAETVEDPGLFREALLQAWGCFLARGDEIDAAAESAVRAAEELVRAVQKRGDLPDRLTVGPGDKIWQLG